jgi:hypothetical protein
MNFLFLFIIVNVIALFFGYLENYTKKIWIKHLILVNLSTLILYFIDKIIFWYK